MTLHHQPPWRLEAFDIRSIHEEGHHLAHKIVVHGKKLKGVSFSAGLGDTSIPSPPVPKPIRIKEICQNIHQLRKACTEDYIGFIEDELTRRKLDLYQPNNRTRTQGSVQPSLLSLHEALTRETSRRRRFSKRHGLRSAVLLSANLLQLYRTPWLTETWSHDDIAFFENADGDGLEDPFISKPSSHQNNGLADSGFSPWDGPIRNQFLFALGILLIELCLDAPFEELRRKCERGQRDVVPSSDMKIANQLLEDVGEEFGPYYSSAVRRCIRCGLDTDKMDLDDVKFRKAVYEGVAIPLEDALKNFSGGAI